MNLQQRFEFSGHSFVIFRTIQLTKYIPMGLISKKPQMCHSFSAPQYYSTIFRFLIKRLAKNCDNFCDAVRVSRGSSQMRSTFHYFHSKVLFQQKIRCRFFFTQKLYPLLCTRMHLVSACFMSVKIGPIF